MRLASSFICAVKLERRPTKTPPKSRLNMRRDTENPVLMQRTDQIANFKRLVLCAQTELSAQIFGANQVGIKVLVFGICCMLPVGHFGLKTLIGPFSKLRRSCACGLDSLRDLWVFFCFFGLWNLLNATRNVQFLSKTSLCRFEINECDKLKKALKELWLK